MRIAIHRGAPAFLLVVTLLAPAAAPAEPAKAAAPPPPGKSAPAKDERPAAAADKSAGPVAAVAAEKNAAPATIVWKDMSKDDRKAFMKKTVLPRMKQEFGKFDGKKFAKFTCKTCHGPSAGKDYAMPNPKMPLPADEAAFMAEMKEHPKMAEFMGKTVKPVMASLLGVAPSSQENPKGFGCGACHVFKK